MGGLAVLFLNRLELKEQLSSFFPQMKVLETTPISALDSQHTILRGDNPY